MFAARILLDEQQEPEIVKSKVFVWCVPVSMAACWRLIS